MSERGVFAVDRGIWDDPDFRPEPFTEREAFMWLVGAAAWCERVIRGSAGPVSLERGEFCFSVRFLAERWEWSSSRVGRFLDRLEKRDTLRDTSRDGAKVYLIKNYSRFQVVSLPKRDAKRDTLRDSSGTAAGQQRDKEETIETIEGIKRKKNIETGRSILKTILDDEHTQAVLEYRARRQQSNSPIAIRRLVNQLAKHSDPQEGAAEMIMRGWSGFRPEWMQNVSRGTGPPRSTREERFRRVVAEHIQEVDSANIVPFRTSGRAICGPDRERSSGELHAATAGHENHASPAYDPLHGEAEVGFDEDGSP